MAKMMMMVMTRRRREGGGGVDDDVGFGREMITFWLLLFRLLSRKSRGPFFPWTKLASLPSSCSLSWSPHECLPVFSLFFLRKDSLRPSFSPVSFSEGGEGFNCLFAQLSHPPPPLLPCDRRRPLISPPLLLHADGANLGKTFSRLQKEEEEVSSLSLLEASSPILK